MTTNLTNDPMENIITDEERDERLDRIAASGYESIDKLLAVNPVDVVTDFKSFITLLSGFLFLYEKYISSGDSSFRKSNQLIH